MLPAVRPALHGALLSPIVSAGRRSWSPSLLSNLVQRFLDTNPTYHASTLQSLPILTPEEPGTVAVPRGQRCALFDGTNDYAVGPLDRQTGEVTVSCWFRPGSLSGTQSLISNLGSASGQNCDYQLEFNRTAGKIGLLRDTTTVPGVLSTSSLSVGTWYHVAGVISGTSTNWTLKLYLNGTLDATASVSSDPNGNSTSAITLGRPGAFSGQYMNGSMRDARVYNVAKSAGEIAAIYNQHLTPSTIDTTGLLGMWPLQEESGTTAYDCSGNGKHLTLTNITQGTFHATDSGVTYNVNNAKGYTLSGSVVIPASLSTPSQDAAGNALGVAGPVAHPATVEVPCATGDGSAVYATTTLAVGSTLTFCAWVKFAATGNQAIFAPNGSGGNGVLLRYNGSTTVQWFSNTGSTVQDITVPSLVGSWNHIAITHTGSTYAFYLNGSLVASGTLGPLWVAGNELTIARYSSSGGINYLNGSISDVRVYSDVKTLAEIQAIRSGTDNRANLLAHWPIQEGPGTSNTNRTSYDTVGSNNLTWTNGTVSTIWANRCPYAQDWCVNYGGGIAANGSFIPGRIGSGNDAAGNAKTLIAGKHGNPFSRLCPNAWSAPELVNIGYTSSSKLAPSTTVQATSPADTKFARIKAAGSDRYFATLVALTGSTKTNAESYVG